MCNPTWQRHSENTLPTFYEGLQRQLYKDDLVVIVSIFLDFCIRLQNGSYLGNVARGRNIIHQD
jgi:hypothetical protein